MMYVESHTPKNEFIPASRGIQAEVKNLVVQLSAHTGEAGPTPWDSGQERPLSPWFAFSASG